MLVYLLLLNIRLCIIFMDEMHFHESSRLLSAWNALINKFFSHFKYFNRLCEISKKVELARMRKWAKRFFVKSIRSVFVVSISVIKFCLTSSECSDITSMTLWMVVNLLPVNDNLFSLWLFLKTLWSICASWL